MQRAFISLLPLTTLACLIPFTAQAQVTPDGTTSTTVNQDGNNFRIDQGNRVGDNLFHSFNEFSVPTLGSAVFNNAGDIANIFSRVTGSNISNIDGLIGANGAANLFLINPNGIIFGQNASLNLGGSFFASTADSLLFEGNAEFSAVNPQAPPLLEVSIPIGARFRDNPRDIVNNSIANNGLGLSVNQGETIALIGGDVSFNNGQITAPGGRVELGGLSAAGEVKISNDNTLTFPDGVTKADVFITNNSAVNLAGAGAISINAQNLQLSNSFLVAGVQNSATSEIQRADITISVTEKLSIEDNEPSFPTTILNNGGDITINTGSLEGIGNFNLNSSSFGQQNSGDINITAKDGISLQGTGTTLQGIPSTFISSSANQSTTGNSGNITIATPSLFLSNISIGAGSNEQGDAGNIQINTTDSISLINSFITTSSLGEGNAGNIAIESEKGNISFDATRIGAFAIPALGVSVGGRSGDITIKGQSLLFTNGSNLFADNDGTRNAGNITLEALESIILKNVSQIGGW
jgi:filamentous hemagglutinin family protein